MPDVIRFGPNFVAQSQCVSVVAKCVGAASRRSFATESARRQFITRAIQNSGLSVASFSMVRNRRYRKCRSRRTA